VAEEVGDKKS
jgi:hypothetical protein